MSSEQSVGVVGEGERGGVEGGRVVRAVCVGGVKRV